MGEVVGSCTPLSATHSSSRPVRTRPPRTGALGRRCTDSSANAMRPRACVVSLPRTQNATRLALHVLQATPCRHDEAHAPALPVKLDERGPRLRGGSPSPLGSGEGLSGRGDVLTLKQACSGMGSRSAGCVQSLDDSLGSAFRITYRSLLRSSSMREPRYPLLRVVIGVSFESRRGALQGLSVTRVDAEALVWCVDERGRRDASRCERRTRARIQPQPAQPNQCVCSGSRAPVYRAAGRTSGGDKRRRARHASHQPTPIPVPHSPIPNRFPLRPCITSPLLLMILPQVLLRKPCYDFSFL